MSLVMSLLGSKPVTKADIRKLQRLLDETDTKPSAGDHT